MTRDEHNKIIKEMITLVTPDNQATATELLTKLSDDYEETLTKYETASTNVQELTEKNEKLRSVNADLFLKVGNSDNNDDNHDNENSNGQDEENELTFEKLFNEKGELM